MKIRLKKSDDINDWYTIVRAEHDGREWMERNGPNCSRYMCSENLSPEACIEGSGAEMLAVAHAIKRGGQVSFQRCAVHFETDGVHFHSPKNSEHDGVVTVEEANELADQILGELTHNTEA